MGEMYSIQSQPNWNLEAVGFIMEAMTNRAEKIIENHDVFGKGKEEMSNLFESYLSYKNRLVDEVMPIYEKYSILKMIFKMEEKLKKEDLDLGFTLIQYVEQRYQRPLSKDNVDELIQEYILEKTSKLDKNVDNEGKFKSLADVIDFLETVDLLDGEKMVLISLYQNRYELMEEIQNFTEEAAPIFEENFHLMKEEYNNSIKLLKKIDNFKGLLEGMFPLKLMPNIEGTIIMTIFPFGGISLRYFKDSLWITLGIYILILGKWKNDRGFQGGELLAGLKALGDATRLNILTRIAKKPKYVQELAEELDLTPATISHHINTLLKSQLVSIIVESDSAKKIYYEVNKNKLRELGRWIESLGDENSGGLDFDGKIARISIS